MPQFFNHFQVAVTAVFILLFMGRSLLLRFRDGINPFSAFKRPNPLEMLLVVGLPSYVYEVVAFAWPLRFHLSPAPLDTVVFSSVPAAAIGAILQVCGILLFVGALVSFGASWRVGIDRTRPGALVTTGVFALSRNPIFLFLDLFVMGSFLLTGRPVFAIFTVVTWVGIHLQILAEERFLLERHGEAFKAYLRRVPRYFGWRSATVVDQNDGSPVR